VIVNWILSVLSAVLLVLLYPRFNYVWLAPVALTPLLVACVRERSWKWRAAFGYAAGVVYWFGLCNWIQWTLAQHAGVSGLVAWLLFALFCLAKAAQMAVFAALAGPVLRTPIAVPAVAGLWVAIERTHPWTGFEWLNLGNAGSDLTVPLRLAPITGVWGLSFVFAMLSAAVALIVTRRFFRAGPPFQTAWLLLLPLLMLLPEAPRFERGNVGAVVVQPNLDDETQWTADLLRRTEDRMAVLSVSALLRPGAASAGDAASIIVWPEAPAPFYASDREFLSFAESIAKNSHAALLAGVVGKTLSGEPLNSALLIDAEGSVKSRYDKVNLVPFGEFVPWPFGLVVDKVSKEAGDFAAGRNAVVSNLHGHRIGTFICYESVFPSYIRRFAASGAEALFNLSNDGWFGKSQARYQHLQIVRMRAAENARWIIRATNDGITAVIDPAGRLVNELPEYREISGRLRFRYRDGLTVYVRFGDWFVVVCALIAAAGVWLGFVPRFSLE
jgi:apolipoprotein N-acyltransferase